MGEFEATWAHYLEQAAQARAAAKKASIKEFKDELLQIAAAFERLAERVKRRPTGSNSG